MPLQATSGAASYDAFGGGVPVEPNYIESVFSTFLYTGNGSTQTINNGIDLAGKGGLVWFKNRSVGVGHRLFDSNRGINYGLRTESTTSQVDETGAVTAFNSDGFSIGSTSSGVNGSGNALVSWTFRKAPKFFDVVTYTGNGGTQQNIPHNLQSSPNLIIVKRTDAAGDWYVAPMMLSNWNNDYLVLNSTAAKVASSDIWQGTSGKSSTTFGVLDGSTVNISGATYVAYLFAHNAGGFGLTGTDNVISCGSYTGTGSTPLEVNLGFEAQWVLIKRADGAVAWYMGDVMRGLANTSSGANTLQPNTSNAEQNTDFVYPTATGFAVNSTFQGFNTAGGQYIYIAIRRGPMKVPTDGTKVFAPVAQTQNSTHNNYVTTNFPVDFVMETQRGGWGFNFSTISRLQGWGPNVGGVLITSRTDAGTPGQPDYYFRLDSNVNFQDVWSNSNQSMIYYPFRRAPGFFDEVCYTGTGSTTAYSHSLGVAPELMIVKSRNDVNDWAVYSATLGNLANLRLNTTAASSTALNLWGSTTPSATTFTTNGTYNLVGGGTITYVAYLFATCPGVSKCGSYTGTGTTQQINCGFTAGARFVLIKRVDSTGDWYVWDSARGIVAGNDPYLLLNSTAAEVTSTDYVDTYSAGFEISSTAPAAINASGGTFIFLAIA